MLRPERVEVSEYGRLEPTLGAWLVRSVDVDFWFEDGHEARSPDLLADCELLADPK
ncbi:hypothetical protein GCM10027034_31620 [Ramlibacter solisilvae]|uniref:hypothetical protein n=1 Tax=Ramlibacter tataouinensis TaxID=94132 RepID=UPI0013142285|nr:hypothetical protein [Ramlibacter tataouinensis]